MSQITVFTKREPGVGFVAVVEGRNLTSRTSSQSTDSSHTLHLSVCFVLFIIASYTLILNLNFSTDRPSRRSS